MLFTNNIDLARTAQKAGVDRIVVDLEVREKRERQNGYHLECNYHTIEDLRLMKRAVGVPVVCRINPINENSKDEINEAIASGADILMLPMFRTAEEAEEFIYLSAGRSKTILLLETKEAVDNAKKIAKLDFDEIYIGLNDLAISYGKGFAYELLADDLLDNLRSVFRDKPFGFGGITILGKGAPLPTGLILKELARLSADSVIIRRAFKKDIAGRDIAEEVKKIKSEYEVLSLRTLEQTQAGRSDILKFLKEILVTNLR